MRSSFTVKGFTRWLTRNGFEQDTSHRGRGGHGRFEGHGIRLTIPIAHKGPLKENDALQILRALEGAGFDRKRVRAEIEAE